MLYIEPHQNTDGSDVATSASPKKKGVLKYILTPIAVILAIGIATTVFMLHPGNISRQEAMDIALTHVGGGHVNWPEMDFENFQRVWTVEVFYETLEHEIYINRFTGEIIRVEFDR